MFAAAALSLALGASSAWAFAPLQSRAPSRREFVCGTFISPEKRAAGEAKFRENRIHVSPNRQAGNTTVEVHFHIITKDATVAGGNVTDQQVVDQIDVLNAAYVNTTLNFVLVNTSRVANAEWFAKASPFDDGIAAQTEMKEALRQGDEKTLNLYSVGFEEGEAADGLLGYATFPSDYETAPLDDGVVFLFSSVPGGSAKPFDLGGTVQHEVGHWTGLFHTFNEDRFTNTCNGSSDEVEDTPWERTPATGCPVGRDSCPRAAGLDPIHNYMDYTDDACYSEFTPGQVVRLTDQMATFRGIL